MIGLSFGNSAVAIRNSSFRDALLFLQQGHEVAEVVHHGFEFGDGFSGELLRFGQFVGVFERVVREPGDVGLVAAAFDFAEVEFAEVAGFATPGPIEKPDGT